MSDTVINGMFTLAGVVVGFGLAQVKSWFDNFAKARAVRVMLDSEIAHNLELLTQFVDALEFHSEPVDHNNVGVAHIARGKIAQNLIRIPLPHFTYRMIDASPDLFILGALNKNLKSVMKHYVCLARIVDIHTRLCALDSMSQRFADLSPGMIEDLKRYAKEVQKTGNPVKKRYDSEPAVEPCFE